MPTLVIYIFINSINYGSGWWFFATEKYDFVSWDDDMPNWMGKMKFMFQTTNQIFILFIHPINYGYITLCHQQKPTREIGVICTDWTPSKTGASQTEEDSKKCRSAGLAGLWSPTSYVHDPTQVLCFCRWFRAGAPGKFHGNWYFDISKHEDLPSGNLTQRSHRLFSSMI